MAKYFFLSDYSAAPRHSQSSTMKRDNVRKEQNSAFPARRHYEAEGRANEDADIPAASAPIASPPPHDSKIGQKTRSVLHYFVLIARRFFNRSLLV